MVGRPPGRKEQFQRLITRHSRADHGLGRTEAASLPMIPAVQVGLGILGPLQVVIDGVEVTPPALKERTLLALLAVNHPHVVGVDQLTEELWPDLPSGRARHVLQVRIAALRKLLRAKDGTTIVEPAPPGYRLVVEAEAIDVHRFLKLVDRARGQSAAGDAAAARASLHDALALWRGEPLADVRASTTLEAEAARLREARYGAVEDEIDAALACGNHHALVADLDALAVAHPLRERLWAQRVLALYRCGRQAEALRACTVIRRRLVDELGVAPGAALQALEAAVLEQRPELEWSPDPQGGTPVGDMPERARAASDGQGEPMPEIRYARTADGISIAYQVVGDGPLDLIVVPGYTSHLEAWWEAASGRLIRRLASFARLIIFDKRGMGLSDRPASVEVDDWVEDMLVVLDAVGSRRAAVLGVSAGGPVAILFAASHPERTGGLVLYGSFARLLLDEDDYPIGLPPETVKAFIAVTEERWGSGATLALYCPSASGDPVVREQFGRQQRISASPGAAGAYLRALAEIDVRPALPLVQAPTLVLHPERDRLVPVELARYMAERIPDAALVEVDSADHLIWFSDAIDVMTDEIQDFLTGASPNREVNRLLATVLFLDVGRATRPRGPGAVAPGGRRSLERDSGARRIIDRFRGRSMSCPGGGILAVFDAPARAVRCAAAAVEELAATGLDVGAGLHSGECERTGEAVRGVPVRLARDVARLAGPGEVLVSQTVADLVTGSAITFQEKASCSLADVPGEWRVYAVTGT
jgi:DNA-binding SARP family transcriptional activator/pimeloyl-ACP methyl ester carboxylesterase